MSLSSCHQKELKPSPLYAGREKLGIAYYCEECKEIRYYSGQFRFIGWSVRDGAQGFGAYYQGKGVKKDRKASPRSSLAAAKPFKQVVVSHSLQRKSELSQNAYIRED